MAKTAKKTSKKSASRSPKAADSGQLSLLDPGEPTRAPAPRNAPRRPARATNAPIETDTPEPTPRKPRKATKKPSYATAESMAKSQRSISVSEFFAKNRHLLGFDNPRKALLTTVKEAVDNALDACEEAGIMPVVGIEIDQINETHFRVTIEDNGPGIVKKQIPSIFGQLLYGSKFHRLRMSRGQQGIGISAAGMYGLLTTGQPVRITSRTSARADAHFYELQIDTKQNRPDIIRDDVVEWDAPHGTRVSIELEAKYQKGKQSVDDYLRQTAIANPHVTLNYRAPDGRIERYEAAVQHLPATPKAIRPHPHGIELGVLLKMAADARGKTVHQFLCTEFSRVSPRVAEEILTKAQVTPRTRSTSLSGDDVKAIYEAIQTTQIMTPATDCVVPIGEEQLVAGLQQVVGAEFYSAKTRRPAVYRGNPFVIEVAIAYGKSESASPPKLLEDPDSETDEDEEESDDLPQARIIRFANRVPLQYQPGACAITKAITQLNWKSYGLSQSRGSIPSGPLTLAVHIASVWVPFTSESKEAIASYPEIIKELKLALQECGRKLGMHVRKTARIRQELKKRSYIEKYIPAIGEALQDILELKDNQVAATCDNLKDILERSRKL
jgi:DNA topoisomerase-6 subunit B